MKFFKFLSGLAFVAAAGALAGTWFLYQRYNAEHSARTALESRQVQLEEQNTSLETQAAKIAPLEQELERLRGQIKDQVGQRDTLKKELDGAYGQLSALKKQIQTLEIEKKQLSDQLNTDQVTDSAIVREAAKITILPAPANLPPPSKSAEKPVAKLETKPAKETQAPKSDKEKKIAALPKELPQKESPKKGPAKKVEEPKAKPAQVPQAPVDQRPLQVLSVNRQFKFVVVNVGLRGNVKVGDTLRVEQGGKLIGRVQVEKLYENFSACNIVEEVKSAQIREGDLVRVS